VGNSILFLGWMLEALAVISLKYVVTTRCVSVYSFTVAISQLVLWPIFGLEQTVSVLVASFLGALIFLVPGGVLLFSQHKSSPLQKVLGAMYCLCCGVFLWRGVDIWLQGSYWLFAARPSQVAALLALEGLLLVGCLGYVLVKKEKLSREMKTFADTDHLTSLYNRRAFLLLANQLIESAIRRNESVALLIIDIDHFKRINDRYGHGVGDGIIANLAQLMRVNMRQSDIACRYGGEEFVILLPDCDKAAAIQTAERLRLAVERATPDFIFYTVSIGVAVATGAQIQLENVINRADIAMYRAKDMGRNRVQSE
jgi:diguanylate cyclase (GGDEF)-like protein